MRAPDYHFYYGGKNRLRPTEAKAPAGRVDIRWQNEYTADLSGKASAALGYRASPSSFCTKDRRVCEPA